MKEITGVIIIFVCSLMLARSAFCQGKIATPQQTLNMYISDLQKNPNDNALREKIIRHVQTMKPKPAIPREAERFMNRGTAAVKSAKDANDFKDAVAEFEKATLAAPWLANGYYNLGVAQDKAGLYAGATRSLKLYVLAEPNALDIRSVEKLIDEIEYKQEKAAKESGPQAVTVREQKKSDDWLKRLDGRRYTCPSGNATVVLDVRGKVLLLGNITSESGYQEGARFEIRGRVTSYAPTREQQSGGMTLRFWVVEGTYTISEDGDRITQCLRYNDGDVREYIFLWQR